MQLFILNPYNDLLNEQIIKKWKIKFEVIVDTEPKNILDVKGIDSDEEKILGIDPDFCEWKLSKETLSKIKNLKAIIISSTSFNWIDTEYLKSKNIAFSNTTNFSTEAVAEFAFYSILNLSKKVPLILQNNNKLDYSQHIGKEVIGKEVGIIGLGNIGTRVAEICLNNQMHVSYWARSSRDERFEFKELEEIFSGCEYIIITLAVNKDTKKLITDMHLNMLNKDSSLITITEHDLLNHELLLEKCKNKEIWGYAFEDLESKTYEGNIQSLPPIAWYTKESMQRNSEKWFGEIGKIVSKHQ